MITAMFSSDPRAYSSGRIQFKALGENTIPANKDITVNMLDNKTADHDLLTGFGEIESFFQKIRHQTEYCDETTQ